VAAFVWPFDPAVYVSSEYGPRTGGAGSFHEGIDLAPGAGTPIPCSGDGTVESNYYHSAFGNLAIIFHGMFVNPNDNFAYDLRTLYAHRETLGGLTVGQPVSQGQIIGTVGNTGGSFGAHLHFETHQSNVGAGITWNTNNNGGYRTAINPRDFMALYGDGGTVDPPDPPAAPRRRRRDAWLNRPPTIGYRTW
jgi:murein DD-endopeptidase MepM/ murein hydrolase activator NlpD